MIVSTECCRAVPRAGQPYSHQGASSRVSARWSNIIQKVAVSIHCANIISNFLGEAVDLSEVDSPHVVAGLLLFYLRELPLEPLLTHSLYDRFISIAGTFYCS